MSPIQGLAPRGCRTGAARNLTGRWPVRDASEAGWVPSQDEALTGGGLVGRRHERQVIGERVRGAVGCRGGVLLGGGAMGRAYGRERVGQEVWISVVAGSVQKTSNKI